MATIKKKSQRVHKELLVDFVKKLQKLNNIELELPNENIETILKDPRQFALNFMEDSFEKFYDKFVEAYNDGEKFALANTGIIIKKDKRYYLEGGKIDEKLPPKYSYGDTLNNPGELCNNCKYFTSTKRGDYCAQWDADVRKEYWCKKWRK
jgi:hypothetical protein